ncbi:DUF3445 domain-containing protein [Pontibaca salina]|uniref:Uncharacterized protein n=1 Tax=Pontibaca salina TaxID=2795731 RepID=A0A934HPS9_9RHOB|nr:hypothetical protein [Pontibaca salina]MBI6628325.1 hypothetical protein [Pontibaca salina]
MDGWHMIGIEFKAGGGDYTLAMTTNAMARYEEAAGESMIRAFDRMQDDPSITVIRRLFWSAVRPQITEDEAGDLIDEIGFDQTIKLIEGAAEKSPLASTGKKKAASKTG